MNRTALTRHAAILAALLSCAAEAAIYRCETAQGIAFRDWPCDGADPAEYRISIPDTAAPAANADQGGAELSAWLARAEDERRKRELETRVQTLQRENNQVRAEFAAMIEELQEQRRDALELRGDARPLGDIDQQAQVLTRDYTERIRDSDAELGVAKEALEEEASAR